MRRGTKYLAPWLLSLAACGAPEEPLQPEQPAPSWPAGTVLAVDEVPILAEEVDALCPAVQKLYPSYAQSHLRRLVLTNLSLARAAVRSRDQASRELALEQCLAEWERLQAGHEPSQPPTPYTGSHSQMGFGTWSHSILQEPGQWVGPIELVGQWSILRLDSRDERTHGLEVSALEFPYIDPEQQHGATRHDSMTAARDAAQLHFVDPEWREYVPMEWQFKMRAEQ